MPRTERDLEHLLRPSSAGVGLEVAGVEPNAAQLVVARLGPGAYDIQVGDRRVRCGHDGGPVGIEVRGLTPDRVHEVVLRNDDDVLARTRLHTPRAPAGDELCRIATISDLHLGRDTHRASMVSGRHANTADRTTARGAGASGLPGAEGRRGRRVRR